MTDQAFTTREVPWMRHGSGVIDHPVTVKEAAQLGGMDFDVRLDPVARPGEAAPLPSLDDLTARALAIFKRSTDQREGAMRRLLADLNAPKGWLPIENRRAVVREDTGDVLGIVSDGYEPVQYSQAFEFIGAVNPLISAAGTLRNSKQAFMVVQAPNLKAVNLDLKGEADPHDLFVVVRTSHDLSRAVEAAAMTLRGRCMNQLVLPSFTRGVSWRWSVRHTRRVHEKMEWIAGVFTELPAYADAFADNARRLAAVELDIDQARGVLTGVLPDRPRRDQTIDSIITGWRESPTVGFAGTGWGLLNAVSDHFEHGRQAGNRTPQSRFLGALEGTTRRAVNRTAATLLNRSR